MDKFGCAIFILTLLMIIRVAWLLIKDREKGYDKRALKFVYKGGIKYIKGKYGKGFRW